MATSTPKVQTPAERLETLRRKKTRLARAVESGRAELNRLMGLELEAAEALAAVRVTAKLEDDVAAGRAKVEAARDVLRRAVAATTSCKEDLGDTEKAAAGLDPELERLQAQIAGAERALLLERLNDRLPANAERLVKCLAELGLLLRMRSGGPVSFTPQQLVEGGLGERAHPLILERLANDLRTLILSGKEP